ncbi:AAA family ATPase [Erysipelothrix urinaevulpis]|uniref:AAA family ATPase n=1 Tax=Erysipelothrix urinaevulpis TaxID=2683717 RepID=UPI00135A52A9|nr:AAA family ATPase [Erysipelothrix urinaevulpis]
MFLKKIEMKGFKSFADHVVIHFDNPVTGIVGPNGCGKSNISDAIRWVLGEQSVKSMRGSQMTDVIFNGSEERRKVNLAEVTLFFNNDKKALNSDYEEVEVTRRLFRDTRESQYLINKTECRLRDIHDLVLDTGLGRDSLSIISQGTISHFAESKPQERRLVFEEAAGVSKYKKRKIESINKLERTKENMERMQDIVDEIGQQVTRLKRASKKAITYKELQSELQSVEVSVLVKEINDLSEALKVEQSNLNEFDAQLAQDETSVGVLDHDLESKRKELFELDQSIVKNQEKMMTYVKELSDLESRKVEIEERRKYTMQVGDIQARAKELKSQVFEAKLEFDDRLKRYDELKAELDLSNQSIERHNYTLARLKQEEYQMEANVRKTEQKMTFVQHRLDKPFESQMGVQVVMDNKKSLSGIHDAVGRLFTPHDKFEIAIQTALAGAMMHVVTEDDHSAVAAIEFLKRNRSGRATFIPLTAVRARSVYDDALLICQHDQGFMGVASDLVDHDECYLTLNRSLLGNVLVANTIDDANRLSKKLKKQFKIVTLEGDVIHKGGFMSGGYQRNNQTSILGLKKELEQLEEKLNELKEKESKHKHETRQLEQTIHLDNQKLMQTRISVAQLEPLLDVKKAKYLSLKNDFEELDFEVNEDEREDPHNNLISELNKMTMQRDELTNNLQLQRERRLKMGNDVQRQEQELRRVRKAMNDIASSRQACQITMTKHQTRLDTSFERLSGEYQMTYEYALENVYSKEASQEKHKVHSLRQEISRLGNVNLAAPEEYEEAKERHDFLTHQLKDLEESRNKLLAVIEEMDSIMIEQFEAMFNRVNEELPAVFVALFGGGSANLILEDPDDLLNTGVDINVQPPGKSVQNIRLFSGGEKSLIAISVLFAILKARHVPLCVFDEVEAALDQANVERLANYISDFSHDTQFIIITHRPGTMAQCDVLYGVTMPNKGVSSMLRVQLDEAIELKEDVK